MLFGCGSSGVASRTDQAKEAEIYLFDDVKSKDSVKAIIADQNINKPDIKSKDDSVSVPKQNLKFYLQVGAFNSKERAQAFISANQSKIAYLMNISFRESDKKFLVRLKPFLTREEAEAVKISIGQIPEFRDTFLTSGE
jgi:cell division septation protein DedD